MGKQSTGDPTHVVSRSSIVLLQERFRQLQKARKRREEREVPKVLLDTDMISPTRHLDSTMLSFQSHMFSQSESSSSSSTSLEYSSLSLGLNLQADQIKSEYLCDIKTQHSPNLWLNNIEKSSTSKHFETTTSSEIDTSLHL